MKIDKIIEKRFENQAKSKTFFNIVKRFSLDSKKILDIGCSYGEHLIHFGKNSLGVTIDKHEQEYGVLVKKLNLVCGNIEFNEVEITKGHFDVIYANNIFEHLYSPHNFLVKIKTYLKDGGGLLILGVPCVPTIKPLIKIAKFRGSLASPHINFFTKLTLINTVQRAGWTILEARGFHLKNKMIDKMLNPIYPHFYVVARINKEHGYKEKRLKELRGYKGKIKIEL